MNDTVIIRTDANRQIGLGHFMRCCSIAEIVISLGRSVLFAVADYESMKFVEAAGFEGAVIGGSFLSYRDVDAVHLVDLAEDVGTCAMLIDSYAVNESFFRVLENGSFKIAYIDDMYLYDQGRLSDPVFFDLDIVINYGFSANMEKYDLVYSDRCSELLIGPRFAPVRRCFVRKNCLVEPKVKRILVTSGSTNPNNVLERMIFACKQYNDELAIDVIVGANGEVDKEFHSVHNVFLHEGVEDLSHYMSQADLALSAGGSTLYELSCVGTPTIALPIVENQLDNVKGFYDLGLGMALFETTWSTRSLSQLLCEMADNVNMRAVFSDKMKMNVDGMGAYRIAEMIVSV